MKKHDFLTMTEMSRKNMDISVAPEILACDKVKNGFKVTVGVNEATGNKIMNALVKQGFGGVGDPDHRSILVTVDMKQFREQSKELSDTDKLIKAFEELLNYIDKTGHKSATEVFEARCALTEIKKSINQL